MSDISLVFTGDIGFDKYMDRMWEKEELLSEEVKAFLKSGDHLVVNVEGPLSEQKKVVKPNGVTALTHSMNPEAVKFLDNIGADVWNICNNHIMDAGAEGLEDTLKAAKEHDAHTLGAGINLTEAAKPVIFSEAGGVGLVAVGYSRACRIAGEDTPGCLNWSNMAAVEAAVRDVKKTCKYCIIVAHDGEEFTAIPMEYTRNRYMKYLEMGADIIVAHHPHVPMNYEIVGDKAIFYSLGNFVFDTDYQRAQFNTEKGVLLKLNLSEAGFTFDAMGLLLNRETETIGSSDLPDIFADVPADEYKKLLPLGAKVLIENTKRQLRFLRPADFENATDEMWYNNFYEPLRSGRVPEEILDFQIVYPLSLKADERGWESSTLDKVKAFMLEQI